MRPLLPILLAAMPAVVQAHGFAVKDLTRIERDAAGAVGPGFSVRAEPEQLDLLCPDCPDEALIRVALGRQADGTEGRVRSGETGIADLQRLCRARSPECRLALLDVAPAVGWVSAYPIGAGAGATAVIIRDADLLTIRSIAKDAAAARRGVDRLLPLARARVVGR